MTESVTVDIQGCVGAIEALDPRQLRSAMRSAFSRAARILQRGVQSEYAGSHPGENLAGLIHAKAYRTGTGAMVDTVYAKGYMPNGRGRVAIAKVLNSLNAGTVERTTSKGWSRGSIDGSRFFERGIDATMDQAISLVENEFINRINRKAQEAGLI